MTTRQYTRRVSEWIAGIGLEPKLFGTAPQADLPAALPLVSEVPTADKCGGAKVPANRDFGGVPIP
jgi:hypothetical protein